MNIIAGVLVPMALIYALGWVARFRGASPRDVSALLTLYVPLAVFVLPLVAIVYLPAALQGYWWVVVGVPFVLGCVGPWGTSTGGAANTSVAGCQDYGD